MSEFTHLFVWKILKAFVVKEEVKQWLKSPRKQKFHGFRMRVLIIHANLTVLCYTQLEIEEILRMTI